MKPKILCLVDSPTDFTGFAEVGRNVLPYWHAWGAELHVWAIGFHGQGYTEFPNYRLLPAQPDLRKPWHLQLEHFLQELSTGGYTHVWLLNDLSALTATDFPKKLRQVCALRKIRSLLYFPVDAALEAAWCEIINVVDVAATYTRYAVAEVRRAGCRTPVAVVPHGVDAERYQPQADRKQLLKELVVRPTKASQRQFATDSDFLLLNVNKNEWRKDLFRSLEILAELRKRGVPAKLIFRTAPRSAMAGVDLEQAGAQLGLPVDEHWLYLPAILPDGMARLYNAADVYLTTTLGEGWGLGITEALACGCPVAVPNHTACAEIAEGLQAEETRSRILRLSLEEHAVFGPIDARRRRRVRVADAVAQLAQLYASDTWRRRPALPGNAREWLAWPRIAEELWQLLGGHTAGK